ncbi:DUF1348 family protein [Streptomyces sp. NPDC006700]|uniref:DUF1348 family protein n=1 Tax=Streptomyces sp. NPDC006700 TaxID=3154479 RepID=UPI0033E91C7E
MTLWEIPWPRSPLLAFEGNRIAVRFAYECHDDSAIGMRQWVVAALITGAAAGVGVQRLLLRGEGLGASGTYAPLP